MEAKVAQYKKDVVKDFASLFSEYPIIGAVNMENLPTPQLQNMRKMLREKGIVLKMTKRRLIKIAIEQSKDKKKGVEQLIPYLKGMPALMFTKENPFKLYKLLQKNKSKAPAKAGQTAPNDILVKAGPTPFAPGPIIGELGMAGIKTGVEGGKVAIKEDKIVVKEGEVIKANIAGLLTRLGIEPMEVGLDLVATFEEGIIFTKDILAVDEQEYMDKLSEASSWAFNLAMDMAYPTADTIEILISKSFNDSKAVAIESNFMADAVAEELLAKAEGQANALKAEAKVETVEKKAPEPEVKKEEPKVEEKKEKPVKEEPKPQPPEPKVEEEKEEVKPEPPKVEEKKEEVKKPEPKVEEKKEQVKPEPPKVEEKKEEVKVEEKKEEPVKEKPKPEEKPIEKKPEPKVEEEEPSSEELFKKLMKEGTLREEKKEEKPKAPKTMTEERKVEAPKSAPKVEPKPVVKKEEKKADIPSAEDMIKKTKDTFKKGQVIKKEEPKPTAEKIVDELKAKEPEKPKPKKSDVPSAHELYEKLKKKGTLRGESGKKETVPTLAELAEKKKHEKS